MSPPVYGDPAKMCGVEGRRGVEERDEPKREREIDELSLQSLQEWLGVWVRGFFASKVGINEAIIRHYVRYLGEQETGQVQLDL